MAEIILQDGAKREFADGCSLGDAVAQLSNSLAKKVLVAKNFLRLNLKKVRTRCVIRPHILWHRLCVVCLKM